eukprot:gene637-8140_t
MNFFDSVSSDIDSTSIENFLNGDDDILGISHKREGLVFFGSQKTMDKFMEHFDFFYRLSKVETFKTPHEYFSLCYKFPSNFEGIEYQTPLGGFYDEEDLQTLSTVAKAFIILIDKEEDDFLEIIKIASTHLLSFVNKEKPCISVSFGLYNYHGDFRVVQKLTREFNCPIIELTGIEDIPLIVGPTVLNAQKLEK